MIETIVDGIGRPFVTPTKDGKLDIFAMVSFPNGEREPIQVSLLSDKGYPLDDAGQVKKVAQAISDQGLDIIPNNNLQFSTFTPEESSILEQVFKTVERKATNG